MSKLSLTDLLSFAKAGYTPKDVKELLEYEVPEKAPEAQLPIPEEQSSDEGTENAPVMTAAQVTTSEAAPKSDDIDYKKLFEEEQEKLKRLQEKITKQNVAKEASGDADPFSSLDDVLRSMM